MKNYMKPNSFIKSWPFLLGLGLGIYFITLNVIGFSFTHFPGDLGDARLNMYFLEHAHKFITFQSGVFWNAPFMYPEPQVLSYSDNLLGTAPFYSVFRLLGFDMETSFQGWFILLTILNYTCCYFFLQRCFKNKYASVLGAFVFAFSMALLSQVIHAQTFPRFAIPLAFLMAANFAEKLKPIYLFGTIFFVVYQLYCGIYLGLMLAVPVFFFLLFTVVFNWKKIVFQMSRKWWCKIVASALVNILVIIPLMLPYFRRAAKGVSNSYQNIFESIPTLLSHFYSKTGAMLWDFLGKTGSHYPAYWDHKIFAGGVATICLIVFFIIVAIKLIKNKWIRKVTLTMNERLFFFTAFLTFALFIRGENFSFYYLLYNIPGFSAMRALQRIINIELLFFAFAVSFVSVKILHLGKKNVGLVFVVFLFLLVVDNDYEKLTTHRTAKLESQERVRLLVEKMKHIPNGAVVSYEPEKVEKQKINQHIDAMLASQILDLKCVNGYTATCPSSFAPFWSKMSQDARENWFNSNNFSPDTLYVIH